MHIFLLILKIIGIVLGSILGLLLFMILAVLFVPIRYYVYAEQQDKIMCRAKGSWFFRCVSFSGEYTKELFIYRFKIFGITVKSNLLDRKKRRKKIIKKQKNQDKNEKKREAEVFDDKNAAKKEDNCQSHISQSIDLKQDGRLEKQKDNERSESLEKEKFSTSKDNISEETMESETETVFDRFSAFLAEKYENLLKWIKGIKIKIKHMLISMRKGTEQIKIIWAFLMEEENKAGFRVCMTAFKKVIHHIKPQKLKGYLKFGMEDPCLTGQILGAAAVFYGIYGRYFQITPDFEQKVLEYSVQAKGRIRIAVFLKIIMQLWFNKELRQLINHFRQCKEELEYGREHI